MQHGSQRGELTRTFLFLCSVPKTLYRWYVDRCGTSSGFDLFDQLLQYDPERRGTAAEALRHPWFNEAPLPHITYAVFLTQTLSDSVTLYPWARNRRPALDGASHAAATCMIGIMH